MSRARPRPCIVCSRRVDDGTSRCPEHKTGTGRLRACLVCGRPSQGNYCPQHEPQLDEDVRNDRNPYRKKYRDPLLAKNRQHRFERAHGRCELCGTPLQPGNWQLDHLVPLSRGGDNAIENLRCLCIPCHKSKTRRDRRA